MLLEELKLYCLFKEIKPKDCPLFVPILVEHRDEIRRLLASEGIYCPVHWPLSKFHAIEDSAKSISIRN